MHEKEAKECFTCLLVCLISVVLSLAHTHSNKRVTNAASLLFGSHNTHMHICREGKSFAICFPVPIRCRSIHTHAVHCRSFACVRMERTGNSIAIVSMQRTHTQRLHATKTSDSVLHRRQKAKETMYAHTSMHNGRIFGVYVYAPHYKCENVCAPAYISFVRVACLLVNKYSDDHAELGKDDLNEICINTAYEYYK